MFWRALASTPGMVPGASRIGGAPPALHTIHPMLTRRRPWQEELAIIDRTMKAISSITDPEELVNTYWSGIGELIAFEDFVSVSRRGVEPPFFLVTRSSRFTEHVNPCTQPHRL